MTDPAATGGLAGALSAASAPLTKLVETVSAGLGRVYEPTHLRRMAKAESDKMVVLANAAVEVSDIQRRAADRWLAVEAIRQNNIEAIADKAGSELPASVGDVPVEQGWAAKFFDSCKDVSQEEMQSLWARLLAGEVAAPGSFSLRTLQVLAMLSSAEAKLFDAFCSLATSDGPYIFAEREDFLRAKGLGFSQRQLLVQAGLIEVHTLGVHRMGHIGALFVSPADQGPLLVGLFQTPTVPINFELGTVLFTQAGAELSRLWRGTIDMEHVDWLLQRFQARGWRMAKVTREKTEEGTERQGELPDFVLEFLRGGGLGQPS